MNSDIQPSTSRKKAKAGALFFTVFMVLGMLLTACGGGSSTNSSNSHNDYITIQTGPNGDFTKNFDPFSLTYDPGTPGMIYESLLYFNQINGSVTPMLADSYKVSSDAKTITFDIRQGTKWSDGQPLTAKDVVFTFNLLKQYPAADTNNLWQYFKSVIATDDHTVVISLKKAYSPILWYAGGQTWIVPQHIWSKVSGDPTKYVNPNPVGSGPFKLNSFAPQLIDYTKNPNYWQADKVQVKELRYPSYNSNTSLELDVDRSNLDWVGMFIPNIQQHFVQRDSAHNHYWFAPGGLNSIYMNLAKAPFNQLAVRQAISIAIDRNKISTVAESGYENVANPTGLILPNNQKYLTSDYANLKYSQPDTAKATQLLESAGFKKGSDGIYAGPDGKKLSFNLNVVTGWSDWVTSCQVIASDLKAIGIQATVNSLSYNSFITSLQSGQYDMSIDSVASGPSPYYLYNSLLSSTKTAPVGQTATSNYERWNNAQTDSLLTQFEHTTKPAAQQQAIAGLEKIMVEQVPVIPLDEGASWYEYNTKNFTGWPDENNQYAVASPWSAPDNEQIVLHLKPAA